MTDEDCNIIQWKAVNHLIRCAFDDFSIGAVDVADALRDAFLEWYNE